MFWLVLCRSSGRTATRQPAAETTLEVREIRCRERLSFPRCRGWLGPPPSHSCSHPLQTTPPSFPPSHLLPFSVSFKSLHLPLSWTAPGSHLLYWTLLVGVPWAKDSLTQRGGAAMTESALQHPAPAEPPSPGRSLLQAVQVLRLPQRLTLARRD